jgi:hypothetical protein
MLVVAVQVPFPDALFEHRGTAIISYLLPGEEQARTLVEKHAAEQALVERFEVVWLHHDIIG